MRMVTKKTGDKKMKALKRDLVVVLVTYLILCGLNTPSAFGDVIIDNDEAGTSYTGTWSPSGGSEPYAGDSLWARDGATYTWAFDSQPAGTYEVLMWWSGYGSRAANISVDINYDGGSATTSVNQSENAGQWNSLGTYYFNTTGSVTITAANGSTISSCADAVSFVYQPGGNIPPTATIDSIVPNPADVNQPVEFVGHGTDTDGSITGYRWESNIGGLLSESDTFTQPSLSEGSHTISFQVQDNNDTWSEAVTEVLVVGQIPVETIIDNSDSATSSTGSWSVSGAPDPYGADSLWARDGATFSWHFNPPQTGDYEVSMYWTGWASRSTAVPVNIEYSGSTASVSVNQQENAAQWNSLGTYSFQAGEVYNITITAQPEPLSTCADAVKFTSVASSGIPQAIIDSVAPNPGTVGQPIDFDGHGVDPDGTITGYSWESSINGFLSDTASFSTSSLSIGTHTITFKVYDNDGGESEPANQVLVIEDDTPVTEIIIDNGTADTSSTGSWSVSGAADPYAVDSYWSRDGATYTWHFNPTISGNYQISMHWTEWPSRSTNVPVTILYEGGTDTVYINQQQNGGQWNSLGVYPFVSGASYEVTIISQPGPSSTCADALMCVYQTGGNIPPTASIDSINPNPVEPGQLVSFFGSGTDIDGSVAGYSWRSSINGQLSTSQSFSTSGLSEGTHTIFFMVQDDQGSWSTEVSEPLIVGQDTEEHIYVAFLYSGRDITKPLYLSMLLGLGASQQGADTWTYTNPIQNKTYIIHFIDDLASYRQALETVGAHIIKVGHSNYGLGPIFPTPSESDREMIESVQYIDDDRIFNVSSRWVHVSVSGMRRGQAYPYWWPVFQDGTNGIVPYNFGDPNGDPPYNYYLTYQLPGDPNTYKIETVHNSALERFSDSRRAAWYAEDGSVPDPNDPNHLKYYITNSRSWSRSCETVGSWLQYQDIPSERDNSPYYRENYAYKSPGGGAARTTWYFTIPEAGEYNVLSWWPATLSSAPDAPYTINHSTGSTTVRMNQGVNGRQWNNIGPFHFDANDYTVVLTDDASSGNVVADGLRIAHVNNPPEIVAADFMASPRSGKAPLDVTFYNTSIGDLTDRTWDFGDGLTNTTRDDIDHRFPTPGTYTISLAVSGPTGSDTKIKVDYITVGTTEPEESLYAEFSTWGNVGRAPLRVYFSDRSTGDLREGITYTPTAGFSGTDTFAYTVADNDGNTSNYGVVTVTVTDLPVANDDSAITAKGQAVEIDVLDNDEGNDADIEPDTVTVVNPPSNGAVEVNDVDEIVIYTPAGDFEGQDTFTYTFDANDGDTSNQAVVTVKVGNSPVAFDDSVITPKDEAIEIDVADNDIDPDGSIEPNSLAVTSGASNGVAEANAVEERITYTPNAGFVGEDTFAYTVEDNNSIVSNEATVTVTVGNAPVAIADSAVTAIGQEVTIEVLDNDNDSDGGRRSIDWGTIAVTSAPANGGYQVHDCWLWDFGDGNTSHEHYPRHTYAQLDNYTVTLTVTDVDGATSSETKENYIRAIVWERSIDNVDYPKTHYGSKTLLYTPEPEITKGELKYKRMLYESCNSGNYYLDFYNRGIMYYTVANSGGEGAVFYLQAYMQGQSDEEIWAAAQSIEPAYDYYNFDLPPDEQTQQALPLPAAAAAAKVAEPVNLPLKQSLDPNEQEKISQLEGLSSSEVFDALKGADFIMNQTLLEGAISTVYGDNKTEAISLCLSKVINDDVINQFADFYVVKNILKLFSDDAIGPLLELYAKSEPVVKGNIIKVMGAMVGKPEIKDVLIGALDDKTVCENEQTEEVVGEPLRICDFAYNQLVLGYKIKNVLRTIGTGHSIEVRDYHINILKNQL